MRQRHMLFALAASAGALLTASSALADTLITDFDTYPVVFSGNANGTTMFRQPTFSGSTSAYIDFPTGSTNPNQSQISTDFAYSGTQSLKVSWQFVDPVPTNAWVRLTTFNCSILPNPSLMFDQKLQFWIYVPTGTPDFTITLGVRETGMGAPIGSNAGITQLGGGGAGIEWIGATSITSAPAAPIGKPVPERDQWVQVTFDISHENVNGFAGATANGVLDTPDGALEHLAIKPTDPGSNPIGPYVFYLDDFSQAPSGLQGDTNGDGCVDDADLTSVILDFGDAPSGNNGNTDVSGDGIVDDADITLVILNFGIGC